MRPARHGWRLVTADADGRWLASANGDGIITVWLAGSGLPVRSWSAGARVRAMTAGPGDLLVVATDDGRVTAWDVTTGTARPYLPDTVPGLTGPGVRVRSLALDPSGSWLAASVEGRLLLWDVADPGEPLLAAGLPCPAEVTALAFDDTGWRLATGDDDGKVHVWDLAELAAAAPVNAAAGAAAFDAVALETAWVNPPGTLPGASRPRSGRVLALAWDERARSLAQRRHDRPALAGSTAPRRTAPRRSSGIAGVPLRAAALSPDGGFAAMIDDVRGRVYLASLDDPARPRVLDGAEPEHHRRRVHRLRYARARRQRRVAPAVAPVPARHGDDQRRGQSGDRRRRLPGRDPAGGQRQACRAEVLARGERVARAGLGGGLGRAGGVRWPSGPAGRGW